MNDTPASAAAAGTITLGGDLRVNRLGFGAMRLTGPGIWGEPKDLQSAQRVLHRALELGINFIDTADSYGPDVSERLIAETLHPYPRGLVIATKGGLIRPARDVWERRGNPAHLRQACEASLKRLRVDRIDLYQFHAPDPRVRLEDSLGELAKLQQEGKIRHIGISNVNTDQLDQALEIVDVVSVQNRFSVSDREAQPVLDACERHGLGFFPWFPLAAGAAAHEGGALERIAGDLGATRPQVALAWLLRHSPVIIPIPGTSSIDHLEENVAAASLDLGEGEMAELGG
jgi:pyridoxine 4-dehydrogenase